jgi:uncharacterized protein DUF1203
MQAIRIIPLATETAERVRRERVDAAGNAVVVETATYGVPCRHCLEDAQPGETMLLFSYCPFETSGPYREHGPIYIHARPCERYAAADTIPEQLRRRLLALRGYDAAGNMVEADVVEGRTMDDLLDSLLARPDVAFVHARNARPGCFACAIVRA